MCLIECGSRDTNKIPPSVLAATTTPYDTNIVLDLHLKKKFSVITYRANESRNPHKLIFFYGFLGQHKLVPAIAQINLRGKKRDSGCIL